MTLKIFVDVKRAVEQGKVGRCINRTQRMLLGMLCYVFISYVFMSFEISSGARMFCIMVKLIW